jgi:hypothetical protein
MSVKIEKLSAWQRGLEKGLSRDLDAHMIERGERTTINTAIENDVFASLNLSGFVISHIGGRSVVTRIDD